jgi:hypothetical protein
MRKGNFKIDSLTDLVFSGFTFGEEWNGWACPYFPFEQVQKIVEAQNVSADIKARYDSSQDKFVFEFSDGTEEYNAEIFPEGKLYPIGNSAWIWEEVIYKTNTRR